MHISLWAREGQAYQIITLTHLPTGTRERRTILDLRQNVCPIARGACASRLICIRGMMSHSPDGRCFTKWLLSNFLRDAQRGVTGSQSMYLVLSRKPDMPHREWCVHDAWRFKIGPGPFFLFQVYSFHKG